MTLLPPALTRIRSTYDDVTVQLGSTMAYTDFFAALRQPHCHVPHKGCWTMMGPVPPSSPPNVRKRQMYGQEYRIGGVIEYELPAGPGPLPVWTCLFVTLNPPWNIPPRFDTLKGHSRPLETWSELGPVDNITIRSPGRHGPHRWVMGPTERRRLTG